MTNVNEIIKINLLNFAKNLKTNYMANEKQREDGYYWCKYKKDQYKWLVCEWMGEHWYVPEYGVPAKDKDFFEINENRILAPDEQKKVITGYSKARGKQTPFFEIGSQHFSLQPCENVELAEYYCNMMDKAFSQLK